MNSNIVYIKVFNMRQILYLNPNPNIKIGKNLNPSTKT